MTWQAWFFGLLSLLASIQLLRCGRVMRHAAQVMQQQSDTIQELEQELIRLRSERNVRSEET